MTIKKLKELDEDNLLTDEQYHKMKDEVNSGKVDVSDDELRQLIKFIGGQNG